MKLRIALALFLATIPLSLLRAPAQDTAQANKSIKAALQPFVDSHSLAGAVTLVADKDRVISQEAVGFSDIVAMILMPLDAIFWIASMSKPITAVGLMMLVDEGKVKLDDPIDKYLPEFRKQWLIVEKDTDHVVLKKPKTPITVRHILTHTSGMPFRSDLEEPTLDMVTLKDAIRSYAMTPLQSEPGTKHAYSNAGINTAGRIIEVVSGMPYEDFMDKRLFIPLGMKDTTFWPNDEQLKRLAKAYSPNKEKNDLVEIKISSLKYPLNDRKRQPMPAGGLFSTAKDVGIFCQMMLNNGTWNGKEYLTPAAVKEMTSRQTPEGLPSWGLGFTAGGGTFGHGGALSTNMSIDTKTGMITVFLVQHQGFAGNGGQSHGAFRKAAEEVFRSTRK